MKKPHEKNPENAAEFVKLVHREREASGAPPVTDEEALHAYDIIYSMAELHDPE
jgi:hypothetical protein